MKSFFRQIFNMMCEDDNNEQLDPLRAGFLSILLVYIVGGGALIFALVHKVIYTPDHSADMTAYGTALAAWAAGGGVLLTTTGGALWMKAKGDVAK